jgi:GGDEF domain-containing protein
MGQLMQQHTLKDRLGHFGRAMALLLNRAMMYQKSHPLIIESVTNVHKIASLILNELSPLVFILNRGQFFVDEEPLDPRINVTRTVALFKAVDLQSISFEKGLNSQELSVFLDAYAALNKASDAEAFKKTLSNRGVFNIKVNHVTFQKVTEDDQIVSRDALKKVTPLMDADDQESRKKFLDTLLESVLSEELSKTLNITNLMADPGAVSRNMIQADMEGYQHMATMPSDAGQGDEDTAFGTLAGGDTIPGIEVGDEHVSGSGPGFGPGSGPSAGPGDGSGKGAHQGSGIGSGLGPGFGPGAGPSAGPGDGSAKGAQSGSGSGPAEISATGSEGGGGTGSGGNGQPEAAAVAGSASQAGSHDASGAGRGGPGALLLHQLEMMQHEVEQHLHGEGDVNLSDLAHAIFDMKKQLLEGIQAQKALGIAYANEAAIVENANNLTDKVILELIKEEYNSGNISTQRLAMIIRRLIPQADDLKRLMPKIKVALLASGMTMANYVELIQELKAELQNEELSRILQESSESIGVDGDELIAEFKRNPTQAAELIYLASEIRAGSGDESALTNILVEYIEQLGSQMARDENGEDVSGGDDHLKTVMSEIESGVLRQLGHLNVNADVLTRMESRLNERMDTILDKMRLEWLQHQSAPKKDLVCKPLTVLQTLENNADADDDPEMAEILKTIRSKVDLGDIEENDFGQIFEEITVEKQRRLAKSEGKRLTSEILQSDELMFILEKEIAKFKRYQSPFSVLGFSFVSAKPKTKSARNEITIDSVLETALEKLVRTFREVDYVGQIGKNKVVVILPMIGAMGAKQALSRVLKVLNTETLLVNDIEVQLRVAGVSAGYDQEGGPDAHAFARQLSNQLMDTVTRVKSIQVLF